MQKASQSFFDQHGDYLEDWEMVQSSIDQIGDYF
jgi:hypothetical protein